MKLEVKKIGNSTGLILPKELLQDLNLAQGDWVYITRQPDGSAKLDRRDAEFEKGMEMARRIMKQYDSALRELAK